MIRHSTFICMALFGFMPIAGCSSFPRDFRETVKSIPPPSSIEGAWQGEWVSTGGHRGQLRCLLALKACDPGMSFGIKPICEARFEAKFAGIFTAHYTTLLVIESGGETTTLIGDHDLGWLGGGKYHYEAKVTPKTFDATYRSDADRGTFQMARPAN